MKILYAKQLTCMPDFSNEATKHSENQLGPFIYEQEDDLEYENEELISRGPYELDNGSIYKGQWNKQGLRHGRGI